MLGNALYVVEGSGISLPGEKRNLLSLFTAGSPSDIVSTPNLFFPGLPPVSLQCTYSVVVVNEVTQLLVDSHVLIPRQVPTHIHGGVAPRGTRFIFSAIVPDVYSDPLQLPVNVSKSLDVTSRLPVEIVSNFNCRWKLLTEIASISNENLKHWICTLLQDQPEGRI